MTLFGYIGAAFSSCFSWFTTLLDATGLTSVFLAGVGIFLVFKFLLMPLFGGARSSDKAKKNNDKDD